MSHSTAGSQPQRVEMAPKGGFSNIRHLRYAPKKGPKATTMILGSVAMIGYGFYAVITGNRELSEYTKMQTYCQRLRKPFHNYQLYEMQHGMM
jgi:hypothetical protein